MLQSPLPYILEDRTGAHTASDFDDIYDRLFFHVATVPQRSGSSAIMIYSMNRRASRHRDSQPFHHTPAAMLEFLPDGSLGNASFMQPAGTLTIPMVRYLRKTSLFGRYVATYCGNTAPYPAAPQLVIAKIYVLQWPRVQVGEPQCRGARMDCEFFVLFFIGISLKSTA